jgi:hypothetical protein
VVPRYLDDPDPGRPSGFFFEPREEPALPIDDLRRDAAKLRELMEGQIAE